MSEFKSDSSVKRIVHNGMYTAIRFGVYTLSGIFFIPFLLEQYGDGSYGLIALAGFLTQYVGLVSGSIGKAVARYLNVALNQNDWEQANEIFSTAVFANLGIICIQLPLFALGVWKLDWLIDFPPEVSKDFRILVVCNIALFLLNIMRGVFFTPIHAANRLDISEKFNISTQLLRLGLLFGLITGVGAKLWIIGVVDLGLAILTFLIGLTIYRKLVHKKLVIRKKYITKKWIQPVLSMAGWSLISALGFSLFVKTDVWIINRFVNKEMAGVYAALLLWPNLIKQVGSVFGGVVAPALTIDFAKGRMERMIDVCMTSTQLISYVGALICGVFVATAPELIRLWLGEEYVQYASWVRLLVGQLVLTISGAVIWRIFVTIGKTKYMAMGNIIPGVLNIVLSCLLVYWGYGVLGVVIGSIVAMFLKENILFPIWVSKEVGIRYRAFVWVYFRSALVFGAVCLSSYFVLLNTVRFSFVSLGITGVCACAVTGLLIILLSSAKEKEATVRMVKNQFGKGDQAC